MNRELKALEIFESAVDIPGDKTQSKFVDEACGGDLRLRSRVLALLAAACEQDEFLATQPEAATSNPDFVGDYRILREIGRGGMGIVYEARHGAMQRHVALKVLPERNPGKNRLERFYREARAAGQLHHTNIVPVFEVGCANDMHYYTMQFIRGVSLDSVIQHIRDLRCGAQDQRKPLQGAPGRAGVRENEIADFDHELCGQIVQSLFESIPRVDVRESGLSESTKVNPGSVSRQSGHSLSGRHANAFFHRIASIIMQAASALEYAHQNKTLHRDIKPANLLLDAEGTTWVLDFGIASKDDENGLTMTGDVVGTLRYISPERFDGQVDPRSDIFSLGLTLYELCTLKHAFEATDRASLVKQITTQDPMPPGKVDPRIPKDLETIVLKSIERTPQRRYQSAGELAEDLRLFSMGHPILARRISPIERVWRVCQRNPVISSLAALLMLSLVLMTIGSVWFAGISHRKTIRAENAELAEKRNSYYLHTQRARATRRSLDVGRQYESIKSIQAAVALLPEMDFEADELRLQQAELRSQAIAAMTLFDLDKQRIWPVPAGSLRDVAFTPDYELFAQSRKTGGELRRVLDVTFFLVNQS